MSNHTKIFVSVAAVGLLLSLPSVAHASLDACGGVHLSVVDECEHVPEETCAVQCEPTAMEAACAVRLHDDCEAECQPDPEPDVPCEETCEAGCEPACEADHHLTRPPSVAVLCRASCADDCDIDCVGVKDGSECRASCTFTCDDICEKDPVGEDPPECEPRCAAACERSCTARAVVPCQVACQSEHYEGCKARTAEQCETECERSGGALFCEGQFIAAPDQQACADQLRAELAIVVDLEVAGDGHDEVACVSGKCDPAPDLDQYADHYELGCMSTIDATGGLGGVLMALGIVGLQLSRRRRRV